MRGRYAGMPPVTYAVKKPKKKLFTEDDLFFTDTFSFGTQIGQITNSTSSVVGMMANFEPGTKEYNLLVNRVKMGCAAQSRQIDKTKIGENVKACPSCWTQFQHIEETDSKEEMDRKNFLNSVLVDRKPYFFRYKYNHLNKELNQYTKKADQNAQTRFKMGLKELRAIPSEQLTDEQREFLRYYDKFLPVLDSPCVMNKICHYIEGVDFEIKKKVRSSQGFDYTALISDPSFAVDKKLLRQLQDIIEEEIASWRQILVRSNQKTSETYSVDKESTKKFDPTEKVDKELRMQVMKGKLEDICSNEERLANHLIYLFYVEKPSLNKSFLWSLVGKQIFENVKAKTRSFYFPFKNPNGSLKFLYENYSIERVLIEDLERKEEDNIKSEEEVENLETSPDETVEEAEQDTTLEESEVFNND